MKALRVALAALAIGVAPIAAAPTGAAPAEAPNPFLTGSDLFNLAAASDPQISPDGRRIAYVRMTPDVMTDRIVPTIWLVDVATGVQRPLVTGAGAHRMPRWSGDGRRLAFVSSGSGGGQQLHVRWMDSGETVRITGLPDSPSTLAWSPDGRRIAYAMRVPDTALSYGKAPPKPEGADWAKPLETVDTVTFRFDGTGMLKPGFDQIFLVAADGGAPRQLTFGSFHHRGPLDWSPDGRAIYLGANRLPNWDLEPFGTDIFALDVASGRLDRLTTRQGPDVAPAVSPDGRLIAYLGFDDTGKSFVQRGLYVMNRDGSGARRIAAALDRDIDRIDWAGDSRSLYAGYDEEGGYKVARIGLDGRLQPVADGLASSSLGRPYVGGDWSVSDNGIIAVTHGDALTPPEVAVARAGAAPRRLTALNSLWLSGKRLGEVRRLDATAPDGTRVPGWLVLPPTYQQGMRVPLILEIHGGPYDAYGPVFSQDAQLYAAAGYAVLYANPGGSTGYGQAFADRIDKRYPDPNVEELLASVDAAVAAGIADPDNLFVTGGSGGGFLTAWLVGRTDRFRAAVAQKPVVNWTSQALVADNVSFFGRYWLGKQPWEAPETYWQRSPLSVVGHVKTPTMVVVGSEDYRTPVSEAEQFYSALKLRGVPSALVKVPGSPHNLDLRPSQAAARVSAILAWFDKYRAKKGTASAASD